MSESDSILNVGWDVPETLALVPFLLLQVSVVVFILCRGRKDKSFRQAFYVFFVVGTIADCTSVIANRVVFYVYLSIPDKLWTSNPSLAHTIYNFGSALEHVVYVANNCQPLCHTIIAFNRFTALALPVAHARLWNRTTVLVLVLTVLTAAVSLVAVPSVYLGVVYAGLTGKYINHNLMQGWDMDTYYMAALIRAIVLIASCCVSFALNMVIVLMITRRRFLSNTRLTSQGQDVKLFVHSLFMFALQVCLTFQCFVMATDSFGLQDMMHEYDMRAVVVVPKWLRLWSSDWLAGDTYCVTVIADASPKEGINYCGTLYGLLTGYLPIGHDQHLEGLIEYVFALSGAPFLLAVSGYVRNAYVLFYFKRLRRRRNIVIHVIPTSSSQDKPLGSARR